MNIYLNKTRTSFLATGLALLFLICGDCGAAAGQALLGATDFHPSPAHPVGWRGDGTGKYPGATPPIHWSRICTQAAALKCASAVPAAGKAIAAIPAGGGYFTEWLVASPISSAGKTNAIKDELVPGEAALAPQEGDKVGNTAWRRVVTEDSCLDIMKTYGPMTTQHAAYAQSCLYSEKPVKIWFYFGCAKGAVLWLNGAQKYSVPPGNTPVFKLDLQAGWNRFLFKMTPQLDGKTDFPQCCFLRCRFWPAEEPREYEEKNIAWITPMPGNSEAMPVIVGDRIFTTAHPYNLVCVDKKTGKIIWIRHNSPYDAATAEEKKANPEVFAKLEELAAKRSAYYADYIAGKLTTNQTAKSNETVEAQMDKFMLEVDRKYKRPDQQGEADWWEIPTPVSDGKNICIFMTRGVSACYDLEGKRRWIRYARPKGQHHGYFSSPIIADGKFILYDGRITALDLGDGSVKWSVDDTKQPNQDTKLWFASLTRTVVDGTEYVLCPGGALMIRARDGQVSGGFTWGNIDSTPVFFDNKILQAAGSSAGVREVTTNASGNLTIQGIKKNGRELEVKWMGEMPVVPGFYEGDWFEASPVVHDGLAYLVRCWGSLAVLDLATMEILYERELPLNPFHTSWKYFGTSVAQAGPCIYLMGPAGVMIVIKAGREYEEVARNTIQCTPRGAEHQDNTMTSTPIFEGNRMYFRGTANLYCVEQNAWAVPAVDVRMGEAPLTVKFDGGKSYGLPGRKLTKYAWDFSDVQASSGASAEHTYKAAGTYIAKLTVTDDKGATDEAEIPITVTSPDSVPPAITSVAAFSGTNVTVRFSEPVERGGAENAANYAIDRGGKVFGATLDPGSAVVTLATTPMDENVKYTLAVKNIRDCARKPNMIGSKARPAFYYLRSPPDKDGYIRNWLMLERVKTNEADALNKEFFAWTKNFAPGSGDKVNVGGKELAWKYFPANNAVINLAFDNGNKNVYYCVAYVVCNEEIPEVRLRIGGSHDSSLWSLNDQELIRVKVNRSLGRDQCVSEPVTLKKGCNVLAAKIVMNGWPAGGFCARFVDKDGNPVRDYSVSNSAPAAFLSGR